jgi:endonuclease G
MLLFVANALCRVYSKVILGSKPSSPSTPLIMDTSIGAFVLPNAVIPDETPLEMFKVPGKPLVVLPPILTSKQPQADAAVLFILARCKTVLVDAVEKAAGLSLFDGVTKATSKELCRTVKCDVIVRRFDDAAKKGGRRNSTGSLGGGGGKQ